MKPKLPWLDGNPPSRAAAPSARPIWLSPRAAFLGLIVFVLTTVIVAYGMARHWVEDSIQRELSSVAQMKSDQIERWLEERRLDVQEVVSTPLFVRGMRRLLDGEQDPVLAGQLVAHLEQPSVAAHLGRFCLRSASDGAPLLPTGCSSDSSRLRELAMTAARRNLPQLEDFHRSGNSESVLSVGMLSPVALQDGQAPRLVAHISMDPRASLFPDLQRWPGASPSAEVLLVRRDADDVLFLNTLRYRDDPPLTLRRPLSDRELLASQAVRGSVGMVRGRDYRGVPSVGYVAPVGGTPWFLVAKMDQSEADAWLDRLGFSVIASLTLVLLVGLWWWVERQRYVASLHDHDVARAVLAERMDYLSRHTHDCILLIDLAGRILDANDQCLNIYGYGVQEMLALDGRSLLRTAQPDGNLAALWAQLSEHGDLVLETEHARKEGEPVLVEISVRAFKAADARCIQAIVRDVTERKRAEARIEDLYQNAPCGYHSIDGEGRFCLINDTELAWLGYSREEIVGRMLITDMLTEPSRQRFVETFPVMRRLGYVRDMELDFVCRDGSILPSLINATAIYAPDGSFVMNRSMMLNLTERKAMEKERERQAANLAELSHRLISVQEDERRRLSAELHDRTSPNLAALDINLRSLARRLPPGLNGEAAMLLDDATALLADTADSIRDVCADLRPPILDYAGLLPALQSYAHQFSIRTGIAVEVDCPEQPMRFAPEVESTLFRIAQEALTNCAKHAEAGQVSIRFEVRDHQVCMEITDDGIGFATHAVGEEGAAPGLGLLSMRERAQFAGGSLGVDSRPGRGTHLCVRIPVPHDSARAPERRRQAIFHPARGQSPGVPSVDTDIRG